MRWFARLAAAGTLSVLGVAALTWASWPRPKSVVAIDWPAPADVNFVNADDVPTPPYRLIRQDCPDTRMVTRAFPDPDANADAFWFVAPDGRLLGPWLPGECKSSLGFDRAGRLLADTPPGGHGYRLARYDPESASEVTLISLGGPAPVASRVSANRSTVALAWVESLTCDIYDVADGHRRTRLSLPGRAGGLNNFRKQVAAFTWGLSPDGRELMLSEAWDGAKRLGPAGVEVYDTAKGSLARRLVPPADAAGPADESGVDWVMVSGSEPHTVGYHFVGRRPSAHAHPDGWSNEYVLPPLYRSWDYATGNPQPPVAPANPNELNRRERSVGEHQGSTLWLLWHPMEYRVLGPDGGPLADWRRLPGGFGEEN